MSWVAVAGTALSAYASYSSASSAAASAGADAARNADSVGYQSALSGAMSELDVESVQSDTDNRVRQIKRAAAIARGTQMAQQAASGIVVGDGSAGQMLEQTDQLSTEDVLATMYSGGNKIVSIRSQARLNNEASQNNSNALVTRANAEQSAANTVVTSSLISGATSIYSASKNFFKPTVAGK